MQRPAGASWRKIDIHAHSPSSFDFGAEEGHRSESTVTVDEWLQAYMDAGIDGLVLADHNTGEGIEIARSRLQALRETRDPSFRELVIFSGVELTVNDGYHLLAIFDVDTPSSRVDRLLARCNFQGSPGSSDATSTLNFEQAVGEIVRDGGLAVPAHVETRGYLQIDERSRRPIVESGHVVAAEATTPAGLLKVRGLKWVALLGSDAHHLTGDGAPDGLEAKFPGSHYSWIKMEHPNLSGLRVAISDGDDSVRLSSESGDNPNTFSHSVITRVVVIKDSARFEQVFSPWMPAIIGGRGVGKSTILELVRLALGRFEELPSRLQEDQSYFSPAPGRTDESRFWGNSTEIEVHFSKLGRKYKIAWRGSVPGASTISVLSEGAWATEPGSATERFPVVMYSQKQIYETAQRPQSLLRMLDQQPDVDYPSWNERFAQSCNEYRTRRSEISMLDGVIETEARLRGELADADAELAQLNVIINSPLISELDGLVKQEQATIVQERAAVRLEVAISEALSDFDSLQPEEPLTENWAPVVARVAAVEASVAESRTALARLVSSRETWILESATTPSPSSVRVEEIRTTLRPPDSDGEATETAEDPASRREVLAERKTALEQSLREVESARTRQVSEVALAKALLLEIRTHRGNLTWSRKAALSKLESSEIKLDLYAQADEDSLESDLRVLSNKPTLFDAIYAKGSGLRSGLVHPQHNDYLASIDKLKAALKDLRTNGADSSFIGWLGTIEGRFFPHLAALDAHNLETEIDLWFPQDRLQVRYREAPGGPFQSIDQASPGQKTAALLAVILKMSSDPLILDQPEDDLDNKLISELVVSALKQSKVSRQVIVVTHNANVVVNADAELVCVMEHGANVPHPSAIGSIQSDLVREAICLIMEGGEPAFVARYKKLVRA
ncbi:TrlF family AAA-like ATPase [Frigoribacterium sp. CG_9.8]|uniref:TrlF family AAA-like ATPase n=1 Tax=Frigoribacterium sp. CG_9.8 TaxID=2787733 RepID=UPI0018CB01DD|nr:AAA family ATPase [Frigoribacterium sp. CG_9.8]MBG6107408.1 putative ATPase [Frigoribacterium sp. CG_9.8]